MTPDLLVLYEDERWPSLWPLSATRPVWDLRLGVRCLWEKTRDIWKPVAVAVESGTVASRRPVIEAFAARRGLAVEAESEQARGSILWWNGAAIPLGAPPDAGPTLSAGVRLVDANTSGRMRGSSNLQIELVSLTANGTTYNVQSGYYEARGVSRGKRTAETVGGGAALGAIIGAIAGGRKGAAIGAGVGAGTGGGVQAASKGQQVKIPSESKIDFTLKAPLTVTIERRGAG